MKFRLYYNSSDKEHLNKNIELITIIEGVFKDNNNLIAPSIELSVNIDIINKCNYVYIEELKRYYYVNDISYVRNNLYRLELLEDELMTWKEYILKQEGIISRQANNYDLSILDDRLVVKNNAYIQVKSFPKGFNQSKTDYTYIMVMGGNNADIRTTPPPAEGGSNGTN